SESEAIRRTDDRLGHFVDVVRQLLRLAHEPARNAVRIALRVLGESLAISSFVERAAGEIVLSGGLSFGAADYGQCLKRRGSRGVRCLFYDSRCEVFAVIS